MFFTVCFFPEVILKYYHLHCTAFTYHNSNDYIYLFHCEWRRKPSVKSQPLFPHITPALENCLEWSWVNLLTLLKPQINQTVLQLWLYLLFNRSLHLSELEIWSDVKVTFYDNMNMDSIHIKTLNTFRYFCKKGRSQQKSIIVMYFQRTNGSACENRSLINGQSWQCD